MVSQQVFKIAKALRQVKMWVHPEGLINGHIYVTIGEGSQEDPKHVLNNDAPFLVHHNNTSDEVRFYNRNAVVRVEYDEDKPTDGHLTVIPCKVTMMDGSVIDGDIVEDLPAEYARLYDYLNQAQQRFIRLFTSESELCMLNKSYIIQVVAT